MVREGISKGEEKLSTLKAILLLYAKCSSHAGCMEQNEEVGLKLLVSIKGFCIKHEKAASLPKF